MEGNSFGLFLDALVEITINDLFTTLLWLR